MPPVTVVFYQDAEKGEPPILEWLSRLPPRARAKVRTVVGLLEEHGHDLRRPHADYLRDGIYELRSRLQHTNYRLLYGFQGRHVVVLLQGLVKQQSAVPEKDIQTAIERLQRFRANPDSHTFGEAEE